MTVPNMQAGGQRVTYREFDAMTRLYMAIFIRRVFAELNPGADYLDNFHIHVIIEAIEELRHGRNRRLAVTLPPRSLKSVIISVALVAWLLGHDPTLKIICVSYNQELSQKLASDCRQVIQSAWFKRSFPNTILRPGRQTVHNFETTAGGGRFSTSIDGAAIGFGADVIIVDDPISPQGARSATERKRTNDWVRTSVFTRFNNPRTGRIVLVMQRLHMDDLIGALEASAPGVFKPLTFAAIAQMDEVHDFATPFGRRRHFRAKGEALHPERQPLDILAEQKRELGSQEFSAQYLQAPIPTEGNLVKRDWLRRYMPVEVQQPSRIIQSWDTASKAGQSNDYSACTTWAAIENRYYLLDVVCERLEFPALKQRVIDEAKRWNPSRVLIEDTGSGSSLMQELKSSGFLIALPVTPSRNKEARLIGVTAIFEAGRVLLPHSAAWLESYEDELCGFPAARHDDQVDSTSQALAYLAKPAAADALSAGLDLMTGQESGFWLGAPTGPTGGNWFTRHLGY